MDGKVVRVRAAVKLAPVNDDYPNKRSVLLLAEKILAPLNAGQVQAESTMRVRDFIENVYLPHVQKNLHASTYKDYKKDVYEKHLKIRLGDIRLRDFRTVMGQRILNAIAEQNDDVGHKTLLRIKSFMSGCFKHARRSGFIDTPNPMQDVSAPGRPKKFTGELYTIAEISNILEALESVESPASVVVGVASFCGLRMSELRGLRWEDFDGSTLTIRRAVWRTTVSEPKTAESAASVPVLPTLQKVLESYRAKVSGKPDEYIFAGSRCGAPLNLANLARRVIIPALAKWSDEHEQLLKWRGWHAFRRSLGSSLYALGVRDVVIQSILRHSDLNVTLGYYVKTPTDETVQALQKIEELFRVT